MIVIVDCCKKSLLIVILLDLYYVYFYQLQLQIIFVYNKIIMFDGYQLVFFVFVSFNLDIVFGIFCCEVLELEIMF